MDSKINLSDLVDFINKKYFNEIIDDLAELDELDITPFINGDLYQNSIIDPNCTNINYNNEIVKCGLSRAIDLTWEIDFVSEEPYKGLLEGLIIANIKLNKIDSFYTKLKNKINRHKGLVYKNVANVKRIDTRMFGKEKLSELLDKPIDRISPMMDIIYFTTYISIDIEVATSMYKNEVLNINENIIDKTKAFFTKKVKDDLIPKHLNIELERKGFKYDFRFSTNSSSCWSYKYKDIEFYVQFTRRYDPKVAKDPQIRISPLYSDSKSHRLRSISESPDGDYFAKNHLYFVANINVNFIRNIKSKDFSIDYYIDLFKLYYNLINKYNSNEILKIEDYLLYLVESLNTKIDRIQFGIVDTLSIANLNYKFLKGKKLRIGYQIVIPRIVVSDHKDFYFKKKLAEDEIKNVAKKLNMDVDYKIKFKEGEVNNKMIFEDLSFYTKKEIE